MENTGRMISSLIQIEARSSRAGMAVRYPAMERSSCKPCQMTASIVLNGFSKGWAADAWVRSMNNGFCSTNSTTNMRYILKKRLICFILPNLIAVTHYYMLNIPIYNPYTCCISFIIDIFLDIQQAIIWLVFSAKLLNFFHISNLFDLNFKKE